MRKNTAFTLLEIMVVTAILGVLASFALPNYFSATERIRLRNAEKVLLELYGAQKRYHIQNETYASPISKLDITPKIDAFNTPTVASADDVSFTIQAIRDLNRYTLSINEQAQITCCPGTDADICQKLGVEQQC
jgi:type IV pilus assembly protein PilE